MFSVQEDVLTYEVAVQIDDLQRWMTADNICKAPDSVLVLLSDAHSPQVELYQGGAGCQAGTHLGQPLAPESVPLCHIAAQFSILIPTLGSGPKIISLNKSICHACSLAAVSCHCCSGVVQQWHH